MPVGKGVLNDRFFRFWKVLFVLKKCKVLYISGADYSKSKSGFEPVLMNFLRTFLKRGFWRGLRRWKKLLNWRILGVLLGVDFMICLGKPVLRAPAVHGVSSKIIVITFTTIISCLWVVKNACENPMRWIYEDFPLRSETQLFEMSATHIWIVIYWVQHH